MVKKMGKLFLVGLCATLFGMRTFEVQANEMKEMTVDVFINEDGSARITENRQMTMDDGTELFIAFDELDEGDLLDFNVEGFKPETAENWESLESVEDKAGLYTVLETASGLELVWGISDYGDQTYTVNYTIADVVKDLEDGQGILWNFNSSPDIPPQDLQIRVETAFDFTQDMVDFWGFGTEGKIQLQDGSIVLDSQDGASRAVILMQFDEDVFSPRESLDQTLEEQRDMAMEGSTYTDDGGSDFPTVIFAAFAGLLGLGGLGVGAGYYQFQKKRQSQGHIKSPSDIKKRNKGETQTTPPQESDPALLYYMINHIYTSLSFEDVFQAYLVKWMKEGRISLDYQKKSSIWRDSTNTTLTIQDVSTSAKAFAGDRNQLAFEKLHDQVDDEKYQGDYESLMWSVILASADEKGQVTGDQIKKWGKKNAKKMSDIADYLEDYSKETLDGKGYFNQKTMSFMGGKAEIMAPSQSGDALVDHLVQYHNYLEELDMSERVNENLSDEAAYDLIFWSILLNQADDLQKSLDDITPKTFSSDDVEYLPFIHYFYATNGFRGSYASGLSSGGFSSTTAASGSGGATSAGGGGGAGGASGGGAR